MRNDFLSEKLGKLIARLTPPQAIKGNREAMAEEFRSLVSAVQHQAPTQGYEDWWSKFENQLLDNMQTRAWPTRSEIRKAGEAVRSTAPPQNFNTAETEAQQMVDWLTRYDMDDPSTEAHFQCPPWFQNPQATMRLIEWGTLSNEREARLRGCPMTPEMTARAIGKPDKENKGRRTGQQRMSRLEWRRHVRVMARLRGQSEGEAEAQELRQVSQEELPAHVLRGAA